MKKTLSIVIVIALVFVGLKVAMKKRAPKPAPPTTQQTWAQEGIPVETALISRGDMEQTLEATGDINALDKATLSAKIAGRVAQVTVREGDRVVSGQTIVTLDQQDLMSSLESAREGVRAANARLSQAKTNATVTKIQSAAAIEQAQAQLQSAKAKLEVVKNPSRSQERMVAENSVAEAKANLDRAASDYKRNQELVVQGAISQSSFEVIETQYKVAQTQYKSAAERLSMIKEGGRTEEVRQAEAQVAVAQEALRTAKAGASQNMLREEDIRQAKAALSQAQAAASIAEQQLSYSHIKSPISGVVSSRTVDPGQVVAPGQGLVEVVNLGSIYLRGDVSEKGFDSIRRGQNVRVRIDAIPDTVFKGSLTEIYPSGSTLSRNFPVRISIREGGARIRPGMFGRGEIVTGTVNDVLLIPKDAVDSRKGTNSVFTVGPKHTVARHIVTVVGENRNYVRVQSPTDLKAGDVVVTEGRQNLQQGSKVKVSNGKGVGG